MPYLNRPYRKRPWVLEYLSRYIDPPEDMPPQTDFTVDLAPFPSHVLPSGRVVFPLSKRKDAIRMAQKDFKPDTVIFATGYTQTFDFLDSSYPTIADADIRNIARTGDESVGFIGFVRPGVGSCFYPAFVKSLVEYKTRGDSADRRDAVVLLDIFDQGQGQETSTSTLLPPASQTRRAHQIWCRSLYIYDHTGEGRRRSSRFIRIVASVWHACRCLLLVRTYICYLFLCYCLNCRYFPALAPRLSHFIVSWVHIRQATHQELLRPSCGRASPDAVS